MVLSNRVYDVLKYFAQIVIPALGTLYFGLAAIWHLPLAEEIVGTCTAVDCFLGVLLGISTESYRKELEKQQQDQDKDNI